MPRFRSDRFLTPAAIVLLAGCAFGQTETGGTDGDQMTNESVESRINDIGNRETVPIEVDPADFEMDDLRPPAGQLVREGAFLTRRRGRLVPLQSGQWVYLFDADADGESEPPMLVHRCLRLAEMIRIIEARSDVVTFLASGEVFVYRNRNYFLPGSFTTVALPREQETQAADDIDQKDRDAIDALIRGITDPDADDMDDANPSVEELLQPFTTEESREQPRARTGGSETIMTNLRREGSMLVLERGRLRQDSYGRWILAIDNDADVQGAQGSLDDRPLTLMPCLLLEQLTALANVHGEQLAMRVSGRVFVFQNENYLLPTMYLVDYDRAGNLISAQ